MFFYALTPPVILPKSFGKNYLREKYYTLMFKGQVHVFDGRVKIVCRSSYRTSAIVKYFVPKWSEYVLVIWTLSPYYFPLYFYFFSTYEHSHFFQLLIQSECVN